MDDPTRDQSIGHITSGIEPDALIHDTIEFVRRQLVPWRDDPDRPKGTSEPKLNLQLCKFLDSRARNDFPMVRFDHEENQPARRSVDLSASPVEPITIGARLHTIYDPFLALECKRLPAPSKDREQEYVTGGIKQKSGGIQRFKLGLHAPDLTLAVMIGYVQQQSMSYWHAHINKWITELSSSTMQDYCIWNERERLQTLYEDTIQGIASCKSVHNRTGHVSNDEVTIHHLWVVINTRL